MTEERKNWSTAVTLVAVAAAVVVAAAAATRCGRREVDPDVPSEAVGWYGAMSLYRTVALWAGKRALSAELNYWKAVR